MGGRGGAQTEETGQAVQTGPDEAHFQQLGPNTAKLDRLGVRGGAVSGPGLAVEHGALSFAPSQNNMQTCT